MRLRRIAAAVLFLLAPAALLLSPSANATTVKRLGLEKMVAASDLIVDGRVSAVRSYWRGKQIVTEVTIGVTGALTGRKTDTLKFVQVGGRVETPVPLEMTVPGAPTHRVGDQGYYFLEPGRSGEHVIVGLFQGHVPVRRDAQGEFVVSAGTRKSRAQFEEEVRRHIAAQSQDRPGASR